MLLTAPIFFPLAKTLGFDLTWFGLIMLLALEIGYTTPPFGLLLFVMKGVAPPGTTMRDIYLAGLPFIACVVMLIGLIIAFPPLATWLPASQPLENLPSNVGMRPGTELAGKVALVTGGARNIGRAIALLARRGRRVGDGERAARRAPTPRRRCEMIGSGSACHIADVTKPEEVKALVEATVKRFGRLDFLVNNAGDALRNSFSRHQFRRMAPRAGHRARRRVSLRAGVCAAPRAGRRRHRSSTSAARPATGAPPSART